MPDAHVQLCLNTESGPPSMATSLAMLLLVRPERNAVDDAEMARAGTSRAYGALHITTGLRCLLNNVHIAAFHRKFGRPNVQ